MKSVVRLLLLAAMVIAPPLMREAWAAPTTATGQISNITVVNPQYAVIYIAGSPLNSCGGGFSGYFVDTSTAGGKALLAFMLTNQASARAVTIIGTGGTCQLNSEPINLTYN